MADENHWLPGFNFNVEEWFEADRYETLTICRSASLKTAYGFAVRLFASRESTTLGPGRAW